MTAHGCRYALLGLGICLLACSPAAGRTWHVPADAPTIQAGIDSAAAGSGDIVLVASGTYHEHGLRLKPGIILRGQVQQPGSVTIDAQQQGRVLSCLDLGGDTRIEGLTLTGGLAAGGFPDYLGGGILCDRASPTITACVFRGNRAGYGGAIYCRDGSDPYLLECLFLDNHSGTMGGALFCFAGSEPAVYSCTFSGNSAAVLGGGFYAADRCAAWFSGCTFQGNEREALYLVDGCSVLLENCLIAGNGGAVLGEAGCLATLFCCDLFDNEAGDWVGIAGGQEGVGGNISADPLFCASDPHAERDWTIRNGSPCSAVESGCGLIGAWDTTCGGTPAVGATWGGVRVMYR